MTLRQIFLSTSPLLLGSSAPAQLQEEPIAISEGSLSGLFVAACDEAQCRPQGGGANHPVLIPDQKTSLKTAAHLANLSQVLGDDFDLVLYDRTKKKRRILQRKLLVRLTQGGALPLTAEMKAMISRPKYAPDYYLVQFPNAGDSLKYLPLFRDSADVISAEPLLAKKRFKRAAPNDPRYAYTVANPAYQWHLKNTGQNGGVAGVDANVESVWENYTGMGITIGIIDDGLEVLHPDLSENVLTEIDYNWNNGPLDDPTPLSLEEDHGTSCAGVSAGKGDNFMGISGAAPDANLVGLRLIAADVSDQEEAEAMSWESGLIQIKNNSWGPQDFEVELEDSGPLVKAAFQSTCENGRGGRGTIHLWAAGNGGSDDNVNYDGYANSIYTIAVGAVTDTGARADYSEPGAAKVVSAPSDGGGQGITTTTLTALQTGPYTDDFGGTSSATPLAAGVCALMLQANLNLGWRDVQEILIASARKINPGDPGWMTNGGGFHFNHDFGAGLIDAEAAVEMATDWERLKDQTSHVLTNENLALAIPDEDETGVMTTFDLSLDDLLRVEHVTVSVNITHEYRGDLEIILVSPEGTESRLTETHLEDGQDYSNWKLMSVFHWGELSEGIWTLKVSDGAEEDIGTLNSATLELFGTMVPPPTEVPVFTSPMNASGNLESVFNYPVKADNQPSSFTVEMLPGGLEYDPILRAIVGTPIETGTFEIALTATNIIGVTNQTLSLVVGERLLTPPEISSALQVEIQLGKLFEYTLVASRDPIALTAAPLPVGLMFDAVSGVISGRPSAAGVYEIVLGAMNADGSDSETLQLEVFDPADSPLNMALDNDNIIFSSEEGSDWFPQSTIAFSGPSALQAGAIGDSESSSISTQVTGPGELFFNWRVSSEENVDQLVCFLDGVAIYVISGEIDWEERSLEIPSGEHTISWIYQKDFSLAVGDDTGWLDQVIWRLDALRDIDLWFAQNFSGDASYDGDADGDGRENLLEYALGSNPQVAGSENEPVAAKVGGNDTFTFVADLSKAALIYRPVVSDDLVNWDPLTIEVVESNGSLETRRAILPESDIVRFFRLEIGIKVPE